MKAADVLARYKPASHDVRVLMDGSLVTQMESLLDQIKKAKRTEPTDGLKSPVVQLERQLAELKASADDASVTFTLSQISGDAFSKLKAAHRPTAADWDAFAEIQKRNPLFARAPDVHADTFLPALIGLSMSHVDGQEVDWDEDDGQALWDTLHDGARAALGDAAWDVNASRSTRPLSEPATGTTPNSGSGSTTPPNEESPTPSS